MYIKSITVDKKLNRRREHHSNNSSQLERHARPHAQVHFVARRRSTALHSGEKSRSGYSKIFFRILQRGEQSRANTTENASSHQNAGSNSIAQKEATCPLTTNVQFGGRPPARSCAIWARRIYTRSPTSWPCGSTSLQIALFPLSLKEIAKRV